MTRRLEFFVLAWTFECVASARVYGVEPSRGSVLGGTVVTVTGSGFADPAVAYACVFDFHEAVAGLRINDTSIACRLPAAPEPREHALHVRADGLAVEGVAFFTYVWAGVVFNAFPSVVAAAGGSLLTFFGHGFDVHGSFECDFGSHGSTRAVNVAASRAACLAPAASGNVAVRLLHSGVAVPGEAVHVTFATPARLGSAVPSILVTARDMSFDLDPSAIPVLHESLHCCFGPSCRRLRPARGLFRCATSALRPATYAFTLADASGGALSDARDILVLEALEIVSSELVHVDSDVASVSFHLRHPVPSAVSVTCRTGRTEVVATLSGSGASGFCSVAVSAIADAELNQSSSFSLVYSACGHCATHVASANVDFAAVPRIEEVSPSVKGADSRAVAYLVRGAGIFNSGSMACRMERAGAAVVLQADYISRRQLLCYASSEETEACASIADGPAAIAVSHDGKAWSAAVAVARPRRMTVSAVQVLRRPVEGRGRNGSTLRVAGTAFDAREHGPLSCVHLAEASGEAIARQPALVVAPTAVECKIDDAAAGFLKICDGRGGCSEPVPIEDRRRAETTESWLGGEESCSFHRRSPRGVTGSRQKIVLVSVKPQHVHAESETALTITAAGMSAGSPTRCQFVDVEGNAAAPDIIGRFMSESEISCLFRPRSPGTVRVQLMDAFNGAASNALSIAVWPTPSITDMRPRVGSVDGGTLVAIRGSLSPRRADVEDLARPSPLCRFGSSVQQGSWQNATSVLCETPAAPSYAAREGGSVAVAVSFDGGVTFVESDFSFAYRAVSATYNVAPAVVDAGSAAVLSLQVGRTRSSDAHAALLEQVVSCSLANLSRLIKGTVSAASGAPTLACEAFVAFEGEYEVVLHLSSGRDIHTSAFVEVVARPTPLMLSTHRIVADVEQTVRVAGSTLAVLKGARCSFAGDAGVVVAPGYVVSDSMLSCYPVRLAPGAYAISIEDDRSAPLPLLGSAVLTAVRSIFSSAGSTARYRAEDGSAAVMGSFAEVEEAVHCSSPSESGAVGGHVRRAFVDGRGALVCPVVRGASAVTFTTAITKASHTVNVSRTQNTTGPSERAAAAPRAAAVLGLQPRLVAEGERSLLRIEVAGLGVAERISCRFGRHTSPASFAAASGDRHALLQCAAPMARPGDYVLSLDVSGDRVVPSAVSLRVAAASHVSRVYETRRDGRAVVRIEGHFALEAISCSCESAPGGTLAPALLGGSAGRANIAECYPPQGATAVEVSAGGRTWRQPLADVVVTSIYPRALTHGFATSLKVSGRGFQANAAAGCLLLEDGTPIASAAAESVSETELTCPIVIGSAVVANAGAVASLLNLHILFERSRAGSLDSGLALSLQPPAHISRARPDVIVADTALAVSLTGVSMASHSDLCCALLRSGSLVAMMAATLNSGTLVRCAYDGTAGPGGGGEAFHVALSSSCDTLALASNAVPLSLVAAPSIAPMVSSSTAFAPGSAVTFTGVNLDSRLDFACFFTQASSSPDRTVAAAAPDKPGSLSCVVPDGLAPGPFQLAIAANGIVVEESAAELLSVAAPRVASITPRLLPPSGGSLTIHGSDFRRGLDGRCLFALRDGAVTADTPVEWLSAAAASCDVPAASDDADGLVDVRVVSGAAGAIMASQTLRYMPVPIVESISPSRGDVGGGGLLTVRGLNFFPGIELECSFLGGGSAATSTLFVYSRALAQCDVPAVDGAGDYQLRIGVSGSALVDTGLRFSYEVERGGLTVAPRAGIASGGTLVSLRGHGLRAGRSRGAALRHRVSCTFGDRTVSGVLQMDGAVHCLSPAVEVPEHVVSIDVPVGLVVSAGASGARSSGASFRFVRAPEIDGLEPRFGDAGSSTEITLRGLFHAPNESTSTVWKCRVGEAERAAVFLSSRAIQCLAPPSSTADPQGTFGALVPVAVSADGGSTWSADPPKYRYTRSASVHGFSPSRGRASGGTLVYVAGENFENVDSLRCRFGDAVVIAEFLSPSKLRCSSPPSAVGAGDVSLAISMNGVAYVAAAEPFRYHGPPGVVAISPTVSSYVGGIMAKLSCRNVPSGSQPRCRFGTTVVSGYAVADDEVLCRVPSFQRQRRLEDPILVSVSANGGAEWSEVAHSVPFTYAAEPQVSTVEPKAMWAGGNRLLHVHGSGFVDEPQLSCVFVYEQSGREIFTPAAFISSEYVTCVAPPRNTRVPSAATVEVSVNGRERSTSGRTLQYVPVPTVSSLHPAAIHVVAATRVTLTGEDFAEHVPMACLYGELGAAAATVVSSRELVCDPPSPQRSGGPPSSPLPLSIASLSPGEAASGLHGDMEIATGLSLRALPLPSVHRVEPLPGQAERGGRVRVLGSGFADLPGLACRFGDRTVPGVLGGANEVHCAAPRSVEDGLVPVRVTLNGVDFSSDKVVYARGTPVSVHALSPPNGILEGGTQVTIRGDGFDDVRNISCRFGGTPVPASFLSRKSVVCTAPPVDVPTTLVVRVSKHGSALSSPGALFRYERKATVTAVAPNEVGAQTGGRIVVSGSHFAESNLLQCVLQPEGEGAAFAGPRGADVVVSPLWLSAQQLVCDIPEGALTPDLRYLVRVSTNAQDLSDANRRAAFTARQPAQVSAPVPSIGPIEGGTLVRLVVEQGTRGRGASVGHAACQFGDVAALSPAQVEGDEEMGRAAVFCRSPAAPGGTGRVEVRVTMDGGAYFRAAADFEYRASPTIRKIIPSSGSRDGGTKLRLQVSGFRADDRPYCRFGGGGGGGGGGLLPPNTLVQPIVVGGAFVAEGTDMVQCVTPPLAAVARAFGLGGDRRRVLVEVSMNGQDFHSPGATYGTYASPTVRAARPARAVAGVNASISVYGSQIAPSPALACAFVKDSELPSKDARFALSGTLSRSSLEGASASRIDARARFISDQEIACELTPLEPGLYAIFVTSNGEDYVSSTGAEIASPTVELLPRAQLRSAAPLRGLIAGSAVVEIKAGNLASLSGDEQLECRFGARATRAHQVDHETVRCTSPPAPNGRPGPVVLELYLGGVAFSAESLTFTYQPAPAIVAVEPAYGRSAGGERVTLAMEPPLAIDEAAFLTVSFDGGDSWLGVVPYGEGNASVLTPAVATAKLGAAGVHVTQLILSDSRGGGRPTHSRTWGPAFRYIRMASVATIEPRFGSTRGGTTVTVAGHGFRASSETACAFISTASGTVAEAPATYVSEEMLRCVTPPHAVGDVSVVLRSHGLDAESLGPTRFAFFDDFQIVRVSRDGDANAARGRRLILEGHGFPDPRAHPYVPRCRFGDAGEVPGFPARSGAKTAIACPMPIGVASAAPQRIAISLNGVDFVDSGFDWTFAAALVPERVLPRSGRVGGGTSVLVKVNDTPEDRNVSCHFTLGDREGTVSASLEEGGYLRCATPPSPTERPGLATLRISSAGEAPSPNHLLFAYVPEIAITHVVPSSGAARMGTRIRIFGMGFAHGAQSPTCRIGDAFQTIALVRSPTLLECSLPPAEQILGDTPRNPQVVRVSVSMNGVDFSEALDAAALFTLVPSSEARSLRLQAAADSARAVLAVEGSFFVPETGDTAARLCKIGGSVVVAGILNEKRSELRCALPSLGARAFVSADADAAGGMEVAVSLNGQDLFVARERLTLLADPALHLLRAAETGGADDDGASMAEIEFELQLGAFAGGESMHELGALDLAATAAGASNTAQPRCVASPGREGAALVDAASGSIMVVTSGGDARAVRFRCTVPRAGRIGTLEGGRRGWAPVHASLLGGAGLLRRSASQGRRAPVVYGLQPTVLPEYGGRQVVLAGANFSAGSRYECIFGEAAPASAIFVSTDEVRCVSPAHVPGRYNVTLRLGGERRVGGERRDSSEPVAVTFVRGSFVASISPALGPATGGTIVTVAGRNFLDAHVPSCRFGDAVVPALERRSRTEILCVAPAVVDRSAASVAFAVATADDALSSNAVYFAYHGIVRVGALQPDFGAVSGGTRLLVRGSGFRNESALCCRFGDTVVAALYLSAQELECTAPILAARRSPSGETRVPVEVSLNGADFSSSGVFFRYTPDPVLRSLSPVLGPAARGGTLLNLFGEGPGFFGSANATDPGELQGGGEALRCRVGTTLRPARRVSPGVVACETPPHRPGLVSVSLSVNGRDFTNSLHYLYVPDPSVLRVRPSSGLPEGRTPVLVAGTNFINSTALACRFGDTTRRATFVSPTLLVCQAPARGEGPAAAAEGPVAVEVTVNGLDFTSSNARYEYSSVCGPGVYCDGFAPQLCPNGTYCSGERAFNFTLCEPGSFQPTAGASTCAPCPVGYFCPDAGMARPKVCPAGAVCDELGLREPQKLCPRGHFCMEGTKAFGVDAYDGIWHVDEESGLVVWNESYPRAAGNGTPQPRAAGAPPSHPSPAPSRAALSGQLVGGLVDCAMKGACTEAERGLLREQPFPCPVGHYCRPGVATAAPTPKNFSTPQRCFEGFFCPRGSSSPEGSGPCPTGYYCPGGEEAVPCPEGHHCPGAGNVEPRSCYPGTFNPSAMQSSCALCPAGHVCPEWGQLRPEPCPPGFVCDSLGLSTPAVLCPAGYYCEEGTRTADPAASTALRPKPCPPATFCLGGVAHNTTIEWVPNSPEGASAPQLGTEGSFFEEASVSAFGTGPCYPGHYCPPGTEVPIEVPRGNVASREGSASPMMCHPGTYAPLSGSSQCRRCPAGFACPGYGTYAPEICEEGKYRSMADAPTCVMCPTGTFNPFKGATDISLCLPVPAGRVGAAVPGMAHVGGSSACPAGYACGAGTVPSGQFEHPCPAGYYCPEGTRPEDQYEKACGAGFFCERGTGEALKERKACAQNYFCPDGTPSADTAHNRCPRGTASATQSASIEDCFIAPVHVCDKTPSSETNVFEDNTYYKSHVYKRSGDDGAVASFHSRDGGELLVVAKVVPINPASSDPFHRNDTVEVFRTCPAYGRASATVLAGGEGDDMKGRHVTVIGRNFRDAANVCRIRSCLHSDLGPRLCRNRDNSLTHAISPDVHYVKGEYLGPTRMRCKLPPLRWLESGAGSSGAARGRDTCRHTLASGDTVFGLKSKAECAVRPQSCDLVGSDGEPFLLRNDTILTCTREDYASNACRDGPREGTRWNPCAAGQVTIDVSNDGKTFSLDGKAVPHSTVEKMAFSGIDLVVPPSYATYTYVDDAVLSADPDFEAAEERLCLQSRIQEEGPRSRESGWFRMEFLGAARLQFNFTHLPHDMVYDEHYRIAVFVRPSVCDDETCQGSRRVISGAKETSPCRRPKQLPLSFTDPSVPKNRLLNLTVHAMEDVLFKVEVHILHGLYAPYKELFRNTTSVNIVYPSRSRLASGGGAGGREMRRLSPHVSFEEALVEKRYAFGFVYSREISSRVEMPLNLPPRFAEHSEGRVLISHDVDPLSELGFVLDPLDDVMKTEEWWLDRGGAETGTQAREIADKYFEVFHNIEEVAAGSGEYRYDFDSMVLPYVPYFSNCRRTDSYPYFFMVTEDDAACGFPSPEDAPDSNPTKYGDPEDEGSWGRRGEKPLPHPDRIVPVRGYMIGQEPVADVCVHSTDCAFEEDIAESPVRARWFEADHGDTIAGMFAFPMSYSDFTGRANGGRLSPEDGGSASFFKEQVSRQPDAEIPVTIDREDAVFVVDGEVVPMVPGCTLQCMPREVELRVDYHQVDRFRKDIVQVSVRLDRFDIDTSNRSYRLTWRMEPLDWLDLIVKFRYSHGTFALLFCAMGVATVVLSFLFWVAVRATTLRTSGPAWPKLGALLGQILWAPLAGWALGMLPGVLGALAAVSLVKHRKILENPLSMGGASPGEAGMVGLLDHAFALSWNDATTTLYDPGTIAAGRNGRLGLMFVLIGVYSVGGGARIFMPKDASQRMEPPHIRWERPTAAEEAGLRLRWKRGNFALSSICVALLGVAITEFSFWREFGSLIWYFIVAFSVLGGIFAVAVDRQVQDALLAVPLNAGLHAVLGMITLGADDFKDFLLSHFVAYGVTLAARVYVGPCLGDFVSALKAGAMPLVKGMRSLLPAILVGHGAVERRRVGAVDAAPERAAVGIDGGARAVEPILDALGRYSSDAISLWYKLGLKIMLYVLAEETQVISNYGIRHGDFDKYLLFDATILPFQLASDVLIIAGMELFHGWRILDYLAYARYRFVQRETRWKGFDDQRDECIEEPLRSLDQMCFSSQYYTMVCGHVNGIVLLVLGVQMILRAAYNPFADQALVCLVAYTAASCVFIERALLWLGLKLSVWKPRHEDTEWHSRLDGEEDAVDVPLEDLAGASFNRYLVDRRITEETFRWKFVSHNRSWLVQQLPVVLTPRTLRRRRPMLINQLARALNSHNDEISSDSDEEGRGFPSVALRSPARSIARKWLGEARTQLRARAAVQGLIAAARGTSCATCPSRRHLHVEVGHSMENMLLRYRGASAGQAGDFDFVGFRAFWMREQRYRTVCLKCAAAEKAERRAAAVVGAPSEAEEEPAPPPPAWKLGVPTGASRAILLRWLAQARDHTDDERGTRSRRGNRGARPEGAARVGGGPGGPRGSWNARDGPFDVSDESEGEEAGADAAWAVRPLHLNAASRAVALRWLRRARAQAQQRGGMGVLGAPWPLDRTGRPSSATASRVAGR